MIQKLKNLSRYFLIGILGILPIVIIIQIVIFVEDIFRNIFRSVYGYTENNLWVTFLTFLTAIALVSFVGYRIKNGKSYIIWFFETLIHRIPVLSTIYRIVKKILQQISEERDKEDKEIVYVEYPKDGLWVPGYVTNREGEMFIIYVPTSPNPTSGFTIIVHESKLVHSKMNLEEVTSFIVSVGVDYNKGNEMELLKPNKK